MKYTKLSETSYANFTAKDYLSSEKPNPVEVVKKLLSNNINVDYVFIREDAEFDAKSVEGSYNAQAFIDKFHNLIKGGSDLSYEIECHCNDINYTLTVFDESRLISLRTNSSAEIKDLLN